MSRLIVRRSWATYRSGTNTRFGIDSVEEIGVGLAFVVGTNVASYDERCARSFYDSSVVFRQSFAQTAEFSGLSVSELLSTAAPGRPRQRQYGLSSLRQASIVFGIHDVLLDAGLRPSAAGGLSLGALVSASICGAIDRKSLFELLLKTVDAPGPTAEWPAEATAFVFVSDSDDDPAFYRDCGIPGVYVGGDFGRHVSGEGRLLMLTGYRAALEELAAQREPGVVTVLEENTVAVHSPLRCAARDFMAPHIDDAPFKTPEIPLCSCFEQATPRTADGVRTMFHQNMVEPLDVPAVTDELVRNGTQLGPTLPTGVVDFPFPILRIDAPEHVSEAVGTVVDLDVEAGVAQHAKV
jgi:[acyl-carrier-protein] S-malonyltransferase